MSVLDALMQYSCEPREMPLYATRSSIMMGWSGVRVERDKTTADGFFPAQGVLPCASPLSARRSVLSRLGSPVVHVARKIAPGFRFAGEQT